MKGLGSVGKGREIGSCKHSRQCQNICHFLQHFFFRIIAYFSNRTGRPLSAAQDSHSRQCNKFQHQILYRYWIDLGSSVRHNTNLVVIDIQLYSNINVSHLASVFYCIKRDQYRNLIIKDCRLFKNRPSNMKIIQSLGNRKSKVHFMHSDVMQFLFFSNYSPSCACIRDFASDRSK